MSVDKQVYCILSELSGMESFDKSSSLRGNLVLDSLMMVTLILELEDRFNIQLDESDMNPFELVTVDDVLKLAERYCVG
ncbi:MAG: acyl carrier protein [Ruminococcaceae bacterium]|nr:acyl carrier protein [Oscillospiraceae bacterium]